jgi:hypothetical protein
MKTTPLMMDRNSKKRQNGDEKTAIKSNSRRWNLVGTSPMKMKR